MERTLVIPCGICSKKHPIWLRKQANDRFEFYGELCLGPMDEKSAHEMLKETFEEKLEWRDYAIPKGVIHPLFRPTSGPSLTSRIYEREEELNPRDEKGYIPIHPAGYFTPSSNPWLGRKWNWGYE